MRLAYHLTKLLYESLLFSIATRRMSVIAVLVIGLVLVALTFTAQAVAPLALYPFA